LLVFDFKKYVGLQFCFQELLHFYKFQVRESKKEREDFFCIDICMIVILLSGITWCLASESQHKGNNAVCIRSPLVYEDSMRQSH